MFVDCHHDFSNTHTEFLYQREDYFGGVKECWVSIFMERICPNFHPLTMGQSYDFAKKASS